MGTIPEASPAWDAAAAELARCLFPPAREPVRLTSFDLPASTHDRLRWAKHTTGKPMGQLVAEAVVVGDGRPFIAALLTLDEEALPAWANEHGVADLDPEQARTRPEVLEALQSAVDKANQLVSRAESIRKFTVLPEHLTEASGHLTPSLKVKRHVVLKDFAEQVDELYA